MRKFPLEVIATRAAAERVDVGKAFGVMRVNRGDKLLCYFL